MAKKFSTKSLTKQVNKWTSGYYSSGYKSKYNSYSNSSFWLDEDFLDDDKYSSAKDKPKIDYIKLAGYKRAIANFVRIVTSKDDIKVAYSSGRDSYTDGKTVVISSKLDEKEFDSTVGLALHEGSHCALTDFGFTLVALKADSVFIDSVVSWHESQWPTQNVSRYDIAAKIKDLLNVIEDRRIDRFVYKSAPGYQGYYRALYDKYFNDKSIDEALLRGMKVEEVWDDYMFHIINFMNPNRQLHALKGLQTIWDMIDIPKIGRIEGTPQALTLSIDVFKVICKSIGGLNTPNGNGQGEGTPEEQPSNGGSGGEGGADVNEDNDTNDEMGGAGADPNLDVQGDNSSDGGGNAQAQQGNVDPKEAKKAKKLEKDLETAIQKQKDFLDGKIKKKALNRKDADKINAAAESNMSYETVGGDLENNTKWGGVKDTKCLVVRGITKSLIDSGLVGNAMYPDIAGIKSEITKYGRKDYIAEGIVLGTLLGKRLKTRDEDRALKTTRMETGRIDRRLVAELGFGNDRVFSQTIHNIVTPSIIHISIDASGSMCGTKWESAMKTSVAIAKAASMVKSLDCVISIRGTQGQDPLMWVVYDSRKTTFAAAKEYFYGLHASGSTPEGLCYQAVLKDILAMSNGKDAYLINICDGEPGFSGNGFSYGGHEALEHTRKQVEKMRQAGVKVLSFFVSDSQYGLDRSRANHAKMYGKDAQVIDLNNLTQLSNSINKMFVRNV
jgi:hypothetical protein